MKCWRFVHEESDSSWRTPDGRQATAQFTPPLARIYFEKFYVASLKNETIIPKLVSAANVIQKMSFHG